ncbi:hypothetical protein C1Y40_04098 [Mycobacterium talmoniae]|uniref:Uncharacterized protein n=1 Tax=Mycobacterium talmoniae TaxID=1858794 RepID=A0A2S8BGC7_9MYCO|nr:hypothetical protein C1Y40_04098 [Mycobacterium talmoniae]
MGAPRIGTGGLSGPRTNPPEVSVAPKLFSSSGPSPAGQVAASRSSSDTLTGSPLHTSRVSERTTSGWVSTRVDTRLATAVTWATPWRRSSAGSASASRCSASSARIKVAPAASPASVSMLPSRKVIDACASRMSLPSTG